MWWTRPAFLPRRSSMSATGWTTTSSRHSRPACALSASAGARMRESSRPSAPSPSARSQSCRRHSIVSEYRVGTGFDAHALADGVPLVLGGVLIEHPRGLAGHSDGDVLAHALTDALLGAAGLEDIGALFPSGDPALHGADSVDLLREAWARVREGGWQLVNADVVLIGEEPRLAPHRSAMRARLADALGVEPERAAVRAPTTDGLRVTVRKEGPAPQRVALLG